MTQRFIICAAESRSKASRIVGHLIDGGFAQDAVSILLAGIKGFEESTGKKYLPDAPAFGARAGAGALLGGAFIWLSGLGTLSVPGLGSLIIAGAPLVAAMGQYPGGDMADVLSGMGLSKDKAASYAIRIGQGNVLISVSVTGTMEAIAAKRIIQAIGLMDISDTADETISPLPEAAKNIAATSLECSTGGC